MRKKEKIMIEKELTHIFCDDCGKEITHQGYYSGGLFNCSLCKKDLCFKCKRVYDEDTNDGYGSSDYYDADYTLCTECQPRFDPIWDEALKIAGRHDDIREVVKRIMEERGEIK